MKRSMNSSVQYERIKLVGKILLLGFGASFIFNFVLGSIFKTGYPFDTFFFKPESKYLDFYYPYIIATDPFIEVRSDVFNGMNPFSMPEIVSGQAWQTNYLGPIYFPFAYWIVLPFRLFPLEIGLFLFWITTALVFVSVCYRQIRKEGGLFYTFIIAVFSYPLLFLLNRSNFEIAIFAFVYIFAYYYDKNQWVSSLALAAGIGMKFLPLAYILVPLSDRKYKQAFLSAGAAFFLNVCAYACYPGGLVNNIRAHLLNLNISSLFYSLDGRNIAFNSSLSTGIKYLLLVFSSRPDLQAVSTQSENVTRWMTGLLFVFVIALFIFIKMKYWEKMAVATCALLLISSSTADYRLLLLYIPFFLWLDSPEQPRKDYIYPILFGLLFIPKSYLHIPAFPEVSISTFLNPLLMLVMIFTIAFNNIATENQVGNVVDKKNIRWAKYTFAAFGFAFFLLTLIALSGLGVNNNQVTANLDVIQKLRLYAVDSENDSDYLSAIGYYSQWILLDPSAPENHLGLARSYSKVKLYWESYQEYKKALLLSTADSDFYPEAKDGIQIALSKTVCNMIKMNQFKWSKLVQEEHNELFPDLPQKDVNNCENN